ncbi:MAG: AI-2E family transporter [Moorellaceae bacterium]
MQITHDRIWRLALLGMLLAGALFFLYLVRKLFTSFLLAVMLAYFLKPAVAAFEKRGWSRSTAILVLYLLGAIALLPLIFYVLPQLLRELNNFLEQLPVLSGEVQVWLQNFYQSYQRPGMPLGLRRVVDETLTHIQLRLENSARQAVSLVLSLFSGLASLILAPVVAYYLLKDSEALSRGAARILPAAWREELSGVWMEIDHVLTSFVRGHLIVSMLVGLLTGAGLFLAGSRYAVIMGIVMGLADLIPYFGPLIGAVPIVALGWLESRRLGLYAVLVVVAVQQIEAAFLAPRILGPSVNLSPLAIILILLAGGEIFGVAGLLLAVPAAAIGRIILAFLWSKLSKR